jgi:ABC-2 type transport system ATP-binding protein
VSVAAHPSAGKAPTPAAHERPSEAATGEVAAFRRVERAFGGLRALRGVDLTVRRGDIYGLLGLNGAGKTTALRILLGMLRADAGEIELFGRRVFGDRTTGGARAWLAVAPRIGAMIEAPAFYPHLDGGTNLALLYDLAGAPPGRGPEEALRLVGLGEVGSARTQRYSQGMLQRLYLAQALLGRPELLVLDEPTSNLDPRGILEVRTLVQRLSREEGLTVILSSHQLFEVEELCNRVAILHRGQRLLESTVEECFGADQRWIEIEISAPDRALERVRTLPWCEAAEVAHERLRVRAPKERRAELNALLVHDGFAVSELVERRPSLEEYFHAITGSDA